MSAISPVVLVVLAVVTEVATLAEGRKVGLVVVGLIVIEVCNRKHHWIPPAKAIVGAVVKCPCVVQCLGMHRRHETCSLARPCGPVHAHHFAVPLPAPFAPITSAFLAYPQAYGPPFRVVLFVIYRHGLLLFTE
mgnify:CR=1 FL=1